VGARETGVAETGKEQHVSAWDVAACVACRANRGELPAPGGVLYEGDGWRLEHTFEPIPLVGWLVLKSLRHVETFADLTRDEAAAFGPLTRRVVAAMEDVLAPVKVYLSLYAEGCAHLHVHLIPRYEETPPGRRGPGIFAYLHEASTQGRNVADVDAAERAALAIRAHLLARPEN